MRMEWKVLIFTAVWVAVGFIVGYGVGYEVGNGVGFDTGREVARHEVFRELREAESAAVLALETTKILQHALDECREKSTGLLTTLVRDGT